MKTRSLKQCSHSQSGKKKSQVMSVDSSISYLLFAIFLFYMSTYVINISKPYNSYIQYEQLYKNGEAINAEFLTTDVSQQYLNNLCNTNYSNVINVRAGYEFKSLKMPD